MTTIGHGPSGRESMAAMPARSTLGAASALITLGALSAGCAGGGTRDAPVGTDSAGVTVVRNTGDDRSLAMSINRTLELGGEASGPESFYELHPRDVSVGSDGSIAVLDRQAYRVSVFGPDGTHVADYGRGGEGPGELAYPSSVVLLPGGEVDVYDYRKQALVRFAADGSVLDQQRLTVPFNGLRMVGTPTGLLLLSQTAPRGDGEIVRRVLHLSAADTLQLGATVSGPVRTVTYESCRVRLTQPPLFATDLTWASNGRRTAVAPTAEYSISLFDGIEPSMVVRRALEPEAVTESVARRVVGEGERWEIGGQECLVPTDEVLEQRGYAGSVPVVDALAVGPAGQLWVRRRVHGSNELAIDVFDASGRYLGSPDADLPFPIDFLPDGRMVTIERDSLDVDRVVVYEVAVEVG